MYLGQAVTIEVDGRKYRGTAHPKSGSQPAGWCAYALGLAALARRYGKPARRGWSVRCSVNDSSKTQVVLESVRHGYYGWLATIPGSVTIGK